MKDIAIVEKARINLLTGARSRTAALNTPLGGSHNGVPKSDPFDFKQQLMRGHGNITAGLGGENKSSSY